MMIGSYYVIVFYVCQCNEPSRPIAAVTSSSPRGPDKNKQLQKGIDVIRYNRYNRKYCILYSNNHFNHMDQPNIHACTDYRKKVTAKNTLINVIN